MNKEEILDYLEKLVSKLSRDDSEQLLIASVISMLQAAIVMNQCFELASYTTQFGNKFLYEQWVQNG